MSQIQFIATNPTDFITELKNALIPELEEKLSRKFQPKEPSQYLTRDEVCDMLKIDLSTLYRWDKTGKLKSLSIGNRVYYLRSYLDETLQKSR